MKIRVNTANGGEDARPRRWSIRNKWLNKNKCHFWCRMKENSKKWNCEINSSGKSTRRRYVFWGVKTSWSHQNSATIPEASALHICSIGNHNQPGSLHRLQPPLASGVTCALRCCSSAEGETTTTSPLSNHISNDIVILLSRFAKQS